MSTAKNPQPWRDLADRFTAEQVEWLGDLERTAPEFGCRRDRCAGNYVFRNLRLNR